MIQIFKKINLNLKENMNKQLIVYFTMLLFIVIHKLGRYAELNWEFVYISWEKCSTLFL